ncbi:MAG: hypothetical protein IJ608_07690 [Lachnospiraceae bacterium]|nr:hypothetical protein [Lachnospiraceae bacterium]
MKDKCYFLNIKLFSKGAALICAASLLAGCGEAQTGEQDTSDKVATASEMTTIEEVVEEGMVPVYASSINDGEYEITVDSSSSMFSIEKALLTVKENEMTATMTMGGKGYLYLYMGTGEEAAKASEESYIPFVEDSEGMHTFTVPVEALDMGIPVAAFSKAKEKWYDRTLLFRLDSLSAKAMGDNLITSVSKLGLSDGEYSVAVTLSGGSGKASVESPAKLVIKDGQAVATIVFSSPNYDYVLVGDDMYKPVNSEGNSTFELPVAGFDIGLPISADTTAMSSPHLIDYTLKFESDSINAK